MDERLGSFEIQTETVERFGSYRWTGVADVFTFVRDGRKVQTKAAGLKSFGCYTRFSFYAPQPF
ncbi:hypothetical protein WG66_010559 [Moniliophthora roreri]|nr:hypothetical protein WG66_010559 [Moniliophthora roreri]